MTVDHAYVEHKIEEKPCARQGVAMFRKYPKFRALKKFP